MCPTKLVLIGYAFEGDNITGIHPSRNRHSDHWAAAWPRPFGGPGLRVDQ